MDRDRLTRIPPRYHAWSVMNLAARDPCPPQRNNPLTRTNVPTSTDNSRTEHPAQDVPAGTFSNLLIEPRSDHLDSLMRK